MENKYSSHLLNKLQTYKINFQEPQFRSKKKPQFRSVFDITRFKSNWVGFLEFLFYEWASFIARRGFGTSITRRYDDFDEWRKTNEMISYARVLRVSYIYKMRLIFPRSLNNNSDSSSCVRAHLFLVMWRIFVVFVVANSVIY